MKAEYVRKQLLLIKSHNRSTARELINAINNHYFCKNFYLYPDDVPMHFCHTTKAADHICSFPPRPVLHKRWSEMRRVKTCVSED